MSEIDLQRQINELKRRIGTLDREDSPPIACRVYNNADIAHASTGDWQALTYNSEQWDAYGMHSTSSNQSRVTVPIGGWYLITGHLSFAANADGYRGVQIKTGGATTIALKNITPNAGWVSHLSIAVVYYLAASAYVEMLGFQSSGGNLDMKYYAAYSPYLGVMRLP